MEATSVSGRPETFPARAQLTSLSVPLLASLAALGGLLLWAYWPVIPPLVMQWWNEEEYSHGFLIPIIAGWLIWAKRAEIAPLAVSPAYTGLAAMGLAIVMYVIGAVGADLFLQRLSMITMIVGGVLFTAGWAVFRVISFPLAYLLLMVPLPGIVFNSIAFPLQLLAAQIATAVLQAFSIPVFREGNILHLASASLDVEEACSGIRSLLSLTALALLMTYLSGQSRKAKVAILVLVVPVTIVANVFRVAATGFIAHYISTEAAIEVFHDFAGMLVFLLAAGLLVLLSRLLRLVGIR